MNTRGLLDQLLKAGQQALAKKTGHAAPRPGTPSSGKDSLGGLLSGLGNSGLAAGALTALLGSKRGRSMGGKVVGYGGLAALGMVAYKAYQSWQANQAQGAAAAEPRTVDRVPEHEAEAHGRAVLIALIAAAKADGHVDDQERQAIEAEMAKLDNDPELRGWLQRELEQPLDPAKVAAAAETPEMAAEMYLASLMLIDDQQYMEKAYLDELARQLRLEPGLRAELEREAAAV
ncbi:tellurite resistance TerB family protein [Pseudomonas oryzihabitans]|uniref:tellurite resistance TerB family protein n=1 Tax=Pseudomonas oryzihabitans TaxID=47885 RepID=UPI00241FFDB1|nr:tellurite resistance TerB family protein [Pseudomonas oryzihabitans]